ncbi:deazaflavin-dependent oxidoreductase (nitroreductase family) [Actinomadura hallensis]|uniref:Deazaflavin-dependent oxidoreductase (Nitroreductase family) n=1 Tax=Actinomadura hallensis TaxID=337895 RepID=A0A543ICW8_9ACTN|nr:nitroreductase/quinone reductase family protein [Actinomadura hallensis]TQM68423.1 deazaflavin-dependent oxidoreductase (nitroreductase family) [Actinomadura hallensis]HLV71915.1 nitroreductase/quinone reductase family protein [Vulgatibacteraceae bacterium]
MRVFLTGASGFVGSYTVRALLNAGHRPRALVRDPGKATKVLQTIGVAAEDVELVPGDMLDAEAVAMALDGCDAAIHSAAAIGVTGPSGGRSLVDVNVQGTRNVVGGAVAHGLDPVVHVSTIGVFVPPSAQVITANGALASPRTDYGRSKLAAEEYVRGLQADGAPVTIVYPGGVCGPHQPSLDALMEGLAAALGKVWPLPGGGVSVIDVRDLGEALARSVEARQGPSRWVLGGHYLTWPQYADLCDSLTGVKCRRVRVPSRLMLGLGSALDAAKRVRRFDYPLTRDAAEFMVTLVPTDDRPALDALGLTLRPVEETVADGLRWLAEAGHLSPRRAGRLAPEEKPMPTLVQRTLGPVFQRISGAAWFAKVGPKIVPPVDRALHRATGGRLLLGQLLVPSLVLTTTGAVSGLPRRTPLACLPDDDGGFYVVGSNFGREKHPAWTGNLLKNPDAEVSFQGRTVPVTAHLLDDTERKEIWPRLTAVWPVYDQYVARADRELRVFHLAPR